MSLFLNISILISVLFFFSISIYGLGKIFLKIFFKDYIFNNGEVGVTGFVSIYTLILIINFFTSINQKISFLLLIISFIYGLVIIIKNLKKIELTYLLIFIFISLISITNKLHDDAYWYHLPYVNYIQSYKIIFGITNINHFIYGQSFYDIMSLFKLPYFGNRFIYLIPSIFLMYFFIYSYEIFKKYKDDKNLLFFLVLIISVIFFRYSRSKEFGVDLPAQLLMIIFFINCYLFLKKNDYIYFEKNILILTFGILVKIYFIFIIPFFFLFFINTKSLFIKILNKKVFFSYIIILISLTISKNFINSGCLIYPISKTCFDKDIAKWSSGKKFTNKVEDHLKANARGYNTYTKIEKKEKNLSQEEYLKKFKYSYIKYWSKDKDLERLLIIIIIFLTILLPNILTKKNNLFDKKKSRKILYCSLGALILCFILGGLQSRYGGNVILAITTFAIGLNCNFYKINTKSNIYFFIILLGFIYSTTKNINRINSEYVETNANEKLNYPIIDFVEINYLTNKKFLEKINVTPHTIYCFNIPMLCSTQSTFNSITNIEKRGNYLFVYSNEESKIISINSEQEFITSEYYSNNK